MTPHESPDPTEAALVARLEAAGWTPFARTVMKGLVCVHIGCTKGCGDKCGPRHYFGPTVVAALTDACEAVGA